MKIRKYTYLLFTLLTATGCSDFVKEYSQDNDYVRSWKDLNEVLLGDCYMPVKMTFGITSTTDYDLFIHFLADEVEESMSGTSSYGIAYDQKELLFGNYTWQQRSGQNDTYTGYLTENDSWTEKYKLINVANNIINTVGDLPHGTQEEIKGAHKVAGGIGRAHG